MAIPGEPSAGFGISDVLDDLVRGLLRAQKDLDRAVLAQPEHHVLGEDTELAASRVWYHFERVSFDLEVETLFVSGGNRLRYRVADRQTSNLIERSSRTRARLSITLAPATRQTFASVSREAAP
jgi:hypothetical protein